MRSLTILLLLALALPAAADCTNAAKLSGGAFIQAGDHEGRIIEELGPPDRIVSSQAGSLDEVRERLIYYIPDRRGRMETIWFEVQGGRLREVCEFQREFFR